MSVDAAIPTSKTVLRLMCASHNFCELASNASRQQQKLRRSATVHVLFAQPGSLNLDVWWNFSKKLTGDAMRKSLTALAAATTITAAAVATPTTADARWRGGWGGPALGGFALGAIVGSAFARPYYAYSYYGYGYGYPAYSYGYAYPAYSYGYPAYYGYGDRVYYGYYGARY